MKSCKSCEFIDTGLDEPEPVEPCKSCVDCSNWKEWEDPFEEDELLNGRY